jgi:hypothetical protein
MAAALKMAENIISGKKAAKWRSASSNVTRRLRHLKRWRRASNTRCGARRMASGISGNSAQRSRAAQNVPRVVSSAPRRWRCSLRIFRRAHQ